MKNEQIVFNKVPDGMPQDDTFKYEETDVTEPENNEVQLETLYISVDPYMRGRMTRRLIRRAIQKANRSMVIISKVLKSNAEGYSEGDIVVGMLPWKKINTVSTETIDKVPSTDVPLDLYLSVLGMPGQTAYHGLLDIGQPKEGETVVVSAASGAVGSVVGQIAKIKGCKVVGIAGGDKKVNYLTDELNYDAAVDYKKDDFSQALRDAVQTVLMSIMKM